MALGRLTNTMLTILDKATQAYKTPPTIAKLPTTKDGEIYMGKSDAYKEALRKAQARASVPLKRGKSMPKNADF